MRIAAGALLAAIACASPGWAQQAGTVSFRVDTVTYTAPMPAGYCAPATAQRIESARRAASFDTNNVTDLTLDSCGPGARPGDYMIVKTPIDLISTPMTLPDILDDPQFATVGKSDTMPDTEHRMERALSEQTGREIDLSGAIAGLGHDDVCGYLGGAMNMMIEGTTRHFSMGGCMTVVGGRVLTVFFYSPGNDRETVRRLLAKARAFALSLSFKRN